MMSGSMPNPTVALVWRGGGEYGEEHVLPLALAIQKAWPLVTAPRLVVFTDQALTFESWSRSFFRAVETRPLPPDLHGWWAKLELLHERNDDLGDLLYFDLDTLVLPAPGLGFILNVCEGDTPILLRDFYYAERVQSGMMFLPLAARQRTRAAWDETFGVGWETRGLVQRAYRGDGEALDGLWRTAARRWQDVVPGLVCSYKVHIRQVAGQPVPDGATVVCFHGHPRPWRCERLWTTYIGGLSA